MPATCPEDMLLPVLIMVPPSRARETISLPGAQTGLSLVIGRLVASSDGEWDTRIICPVDGLVEHVAFRSGDKGHVDDRALPIARLVGLVLVVLLRHGVDGLDDAARVSLTAALIAADLDANEVGPGSHACVAGSGQTRDVGAVAVGVIEG
ncbi:hypothetical protein HG530_010775 [Fusarium avenaceum]|nr:hypothetical protein HG530_010775 [Fusarium avenaceum]